MILPSSSQIQWITPPEVFPTVPLSNIPVKSSPFSMIIFPSL